MRETEKPPEGLLLFLTVPTAFGSIVPIAIVAGVATFATVQKGHFT
ncbi:MAG: hypothetical protein IKI66_00540 [Bacteroidales bacterium]|nr:hypothetical protein [Bacteroidales bacterium]